jgi:hypothetical protein
MIFHDTPDATGVGVPFIIPPLPMNHLPFHPIRSNEGAWGNSYAIIEP